MILVFFFKTVIFFFILNWFGKQKKQLIGIVFEIII